MMVKNKQEAPLHLSDLFKVGEMIDVALSLDGKDHKFQIWLRKPTVEQQGRARTKAQAMSARVRTKYRTEDTDEYESLQSDIDLMEDPQEIIDRFSDLEKPKLRTQAFNEVLHDKKVGSDWSDEKQDYHGVIEGINVRLEEIERHNDALPEGDDDMRIDATKDEEVVRMNETWDLFESEVLARQEELDTELRNTYALWSLTDLKKKFTKDLIELEAQSAWMQEYRSRMLHYACRRPDSKKTLYFHEMQDILELPLMIQQQLFNDLDKLQSADPKELAVPLSFSS